MGWNFGDLLDLIGPEMPDDAPAFVHGDRVITWPQTTARSNNLAAALIKNGAQPGDKVAFYLRNGPEYMETMAACFKARLTHVNINYRYNAQEVYYILDNADAQTIVYSSDFKDIIAELKPQLTKTKTFVEVTPDGQVLDGSFSYETLCNEGNGKPLQIKREGSDQLFIYTGGTTGMPKGVMWSHTAIREVQLDAMRKLGAAPETMEQVKLMMSMMEERPCILPACPLMHGTGLLTALGSMMNGGCVVTTPAVGLDPQELWQAAAKNNVLSMAIVGDAFAKPLLKELDDNPDKYDLSKMMTIVSSGVMWSTEVKRGLLKHLPQATMTDAFGSSEGLGFGSSQMTAEGEIATARFAIGDKCKVFDENNVEVEAGSGTPGFIALTGNIPEGYYKDPKKSAETFREVNGVRYSIPGDWCTVEPDGTLTLLGRGSVCINTAGEKVYPEEVEEALKTHADVDDALVIGLEDEKWGQAVTAIVRPTSNTSPDEAELRKFVRGILAGYKAPKRIFFNEVAFRAPNGKADYKGAKKFAESQPA
ncbi:MAG: acyl-CoA synthetase [Parvibaculaceae bacterium]|nr:acyl-CoA synthetase [Parvibaculaceae bacterium]